jgi:mono/diheme cytochrome c family protein
MLHRRVAVPLFAGLAALALGGCGSQGIELDEGATAQVQRGAVLFAERCSGCHTIDTAGAEGSATSVHDRERVDGPNFNVRCESKDNVLYAIRNGGYSGAIMPENLVVGRQAEDVAEYLAKYAGREARAGCAEG